MLFGFVGKMIFWISAVYDPTRRNEVINLNGLCVPNWLVGGVLKVVKFLRSIRELKILVS